MTSRPALRFMFIHGPGSSGRLFPLVQTEMFRHLSDFLDSVALHEEDEEPEITTHPKAIELLHSKRISLSEFVGKKRNGKENGNLREKEKEKEKEKDKQFNDTCPVCLCDFEQELNEAEDEDVVILSSSFSCCKRISKQKRLQLEKESDTKKDKNTTIPSSSSSSSSSSASSYLSSSSSCPSLVIMPCGHVLHDSCIFPWLKNANKCPSCRFELPTTNASYNKRKVFTQPRRSDFLDEFEPRAKKRKVSK